MNTFTKTALFLAGLMVSTANVFGQATTERRANAMTDWMKDNLKLSAEQETPVYTINLKYAGLHEDISLNYQTKEDKMKAWDITRKEKKKELRKVLTPEQFADYEQVEEAMRQKLREQERQAKVEAKTQK